MEDETHLLQGLTDVLVDMGYQVLSALSGQEAMKLLDAGKQFDLLLTDIVMPGGLGGFELAKRVREVHPDVPVLYSPGYTGYSAQEMGPVQAPLMQKPTLPQELAEALFDVLSSAKK